MSKSDKYKSYQEQLDNNTNFGTTSPVLDADGNPVLNADGKPTYTINPEFKVDDVGGESVQRYSPTPETTTDPSKSNTGSGLEAALGTSYSWMDNAEERANLSYKSDVLNAKAEYLTNRQQIESQGQTGQQQIDMQKYTQNQSADKVGWTGGYVLDQERQMNYLKETIKAQMYGQMELQKYGYDTSLAAARLAYDTNRYDLALEYYNTALSRAVSEAEITGYYVSPEAREMLDEYSLAAKVLNTEGVSDEDKLRANKVIESVYSWFEDNGISKNGVETMARQDFIQTLRAAAEAKLQYANQDIYGLIGGKFGRVDANGNLLYNDDNNQVQTFDFGSMSAQEILEYGISGSDIAKEQVHGYIDNLIQGDLQSYLDSISTTGTKADGSTVKTVGEIKSQDFEKVVAESAAKVFEELKNAAGDNEAYKKLLQSYNYSTELNGHSVKVTLSDSGKFQFSYDGKAIGEALTSASQDLTSELNKSVNSTDTSVNFARLAEVYPDLFKTYTMTVEDHNIAGDRSDDDFDVNIGNKNYDLDVDWKADKKMFAANEYRKGQGEFDKTTGKLKELYPNQSSNTFVIYGGELWFYSSKLGKWGYVQQNTGGSKLYDDLQTAFKGSVPSRWKE